MTPADGGAAFPCSPGDVPFWNEGMSLRDFFAAQFIMGFRHSTVTYSREHMAAGAYKMADAMLAERSK